MGAGRKNKRKKIAEINTLPNVYQCPDFNEGELLTATGERVNYRCRWCESVFGNKHPLTLELACGKGDYTVALAAQYPVRNFIGVDIKGPRIHTGAKAAIDQGLHNVAFSRIKIENILTFYGEGEVDEIWITFPDPFPKDRHEKHRLTYSSFLDRYKQILRAGGVVHFKTDDLPLFRYSVESVRAYGVQLQYVQEDIYAAPLDIPELEIKTFYELQHLAKGRTINYMRFAF